MTSNIDKFGRIHISREDHERLCKVWNAAHGLPHHSGNLIQRDQWVSSETAKEIKAATAKTSSMWSCSGCGEQFDTNSIPCPAGPEFVTATRCSRCS